MAKDSSINVDTTEVLDDNSSLHPSSHQNPTHTTVPELPHQWPAEPVPLTPEPTTERWLLAYDIALCVIPLALIAKAVMCIVASVIDKKNTGWDVDKVHALTIYLLKFNHQLTTIFTVVFVLIITTLVRRLALFMAQEGSATVAKLEQLQASISLPGTLKAIWSLRSFGRTSCILLFVWGWFYLGSQAVTSEYKYKTSAAHRKVPMAYFSTERPSLFYANGSPAVVSSLDISTINAMYSVFSTVSATHGTSEAAYDLNGAAKVPYLRRDGSPDFGGKPLRKNRHGYFDIKEASNVIYASWIGTSIFTFFGGENGLYINGVEGTYTTNSTFLNATCSVPGVREAAAFPSGVDPKAQISINMTARDAALPLQPQDPPPTFDIWARFNESSPVMYTTCSLQQIPVQLKLECVTATCAAKQVRFTPGLSPVNRTAFDNGNFTSAFFENLLLSQGFPGDYEYSISNLAGNGLVSAIFTAFDTIADTINDPIDNPISSLDPSYIAPGGTFQSDVSIAITQIINTYYDASIDPLQGSYQDPLIRQDNINDLVIGNITSPGWYHGTFKGNLYSPQYVLSIPWVIVDLMSCQILLLAAVAAAWLRKRTLAPDIFGYVSSLTRDNPHLNLPDGGSTMSGMERARALKKVKIRIGDVADENGVGRVGLRHAGPEVESTAEMVHLKRDRQYV